jgi:hypothetical protein
MTQAASRNPNKCRINQQMDFNCLDVLLPAGAFSQAQASSNGQAISTALASAGATAAQQCLPGTSTSPVPRYVVAQAEPLIITQPTLLFQGQLVGFGCGGVTGLSSGYCSDAATIISHTADDDAKQSTRVPLPCSATSLAHHLAVSLQRTSESRYITRASTRASTTFRNLQRADHASLTCCTVRGRLQQLHVMLLLLFPVAPISYHRVAIKLICCCQQGGCILLLHHRITCNQLLAGMLYACL